MSVRRGVSGGLDLVMRIDHLVTKWRLDFRVSRPVGHVFYGVILTPSIAFPRQSVSHDTPHLLCTFRTCACWTRHLDSCFPFCCRCQKEGHCNPQAPRCDSMYVLVLAKAIGSNTYIHTSSGAVSGEIVTCCDP